MFSEWYSPQVGRQLANKVELENVEVKLKLSTLKPLQVGWIIELSNEMKLSKGAGIIKSGWLSSGIKGAVDLGLEKLPSIDPFEELNSMIPDSEDVVKSNTLCLTAIACFTEDWAWHIEIKR